MIKPLKLDSTKQGIWFTSDMHFGHRNIMRFCNRPFDSVEEMDEALINNWNAIVEEGDIVFNLGDFAYASNSRWKEILERLKGTHYLVLGNHDISRWPGDKVMTLFAGVEHQMLLDIDGRKVYLNHYPFLCYGGTYKKADEVVWQLFGHVHSGRSNTGRDSNRLELLFPYQYDVGVDNNNYMPISWREIKIIMEGRQSKLNN